MGRKRTGRQSRLMRILVLCCSMIGFALITLIAIDGWIEYRAEERLYKSIEDVPENKVGLVLGTSKYSTQGHNLFYTARLEAAYELWKSGKIQYLLVSGDNGTKAYNEPQTFRSDLISMGIPDERIVLDYAGFRTLDSVVRAKEVFQQDKVTIISQQFHIERALFIADFKGLDAIGYTAENVGGDRGLAVKLRERFARMKMILDLVTGKEPKFLGKKEQIG